MTQDIVVIFFKFLHLSGTNFENTRHSHNIGRVEVGFVKNEI